MTFYDTILPERHREPSSLSFSGIRIPAISTMPGAQHRDSCRYCGRKVRRSCVSALITRPERLTRHPLALHCTFKRKRGGQTASSAYQPPTPLPPTATKGLVSEHEHHEVYRDHKIHPTVSDPEGWDNPPHDGLGKTSLY